MLTRPNAEPLEVGAVGEPEVIDLSARGSVVQELNTGDLATAVGMPDVDPDAPPTLDDIRQWMQANLFGQVSASRIPALPWAHLFDGAVELLDDPGFDNASTFSSGDPKVNRDAEFGRRKPGSARIDADGGTHLVVTNLIPVEQGEKLPLGVHVFYEELAASSAPVRVSVRAYHRNTDDSVTLLATTQVAALSVLSGDSADHPDQDDDWVWLGGTYTVPGPIGGLSVDEVVGEVKVDATSGTIWADDATVTKTRDGMPQAWILSLVPDLTSLWNGVSGTVETIMTALGLTPSGTFWDDLFDLSDEIAWIQDKAAEAGADAAAALADLANKLGISDWDDWLAAQWDTFKATLLSNPGSLLGALGMNKITGLVDLNSLTTQIRDILAGVATVPTLPIIQDIKDWWTSIGQKTQSLTTGGTLPPTSVGSTAGGSSLGQDIVDTWNKFWDGIFKTTGSTGKTPADVQTAAASVSTTAAIAQESTATLANLMNAPKNIPFWVSPNPFEDVVFPRVMASEAKIFTGGRLYLTALRTTQNRIYNQVGFMTNGGDPQENVFVAVYRIDPANGTYTLEYDFGNVSSQILTGSGLVDQRFNMPYDLQASEGDLWAVGILTTGTGSYPSLVCVASSAMDYTGLHPRCATAVLASQTSIPASVSAASVTRAADRVWASLGQALDFEVPTIQLAEQFSTGQWGSSAWYLFGSGDYDDRTGVIASDGGLHMRVTPGYSLPIPKTINRSSGIHKTAMSTNNMASEVTIARVPDTSVPPIWAIVRARNNSTLGAALEITANQARIITFDAAADPTPTARATASTTVSVGDVFRIEAVGTVYTAYRNGVPIPGCTWTDTGNAVIPLVASLRRTGWLVSFNAGFSSQDHSAWIAAWRGYDVV
ncbi:hypothetical protein A5743_14420 [Mycolicibacterium conceptionense]|nr:hypothetical protein A5743_14420 [Mycolicibacterium conceptionense]